MISASRAVIGNTYSTAHNIAVEVLEKKEKEVVVRSLETQNNVQLPLDYQLAPIVKIVEEIAMSQETNQPADSNTAVAAKPKTGKLKKSNVVDEGLASNLSVDDIVKNVLAVFPETPEKSVRNLISVRRSKLKKTN